MFSELQPQGSFQNNYCVNLANILNVGVHFECKSFPQSAMINWDKALLSPKISQKLARCFANPAPGLFFSCEGWGVREDIAQMQFFFIFSHPSFYRGHHNMDSWRGNFRGRLGTLTFLFPILSHYIYG
jgi:hypothetical protein